MPHDFLSSVLAATRPGEALLFWLERHKSLPLMEHSGLIPAGPPPWHNGSVIEHLAWCMDAVAGDPLAVWLALAHDAGKLSTPKAILPHHYGHEERGERLAPIWAKELGLPASWAEAAMVTAREHMRAGRYRALRRGKKYDLLMEIMPREFAAAFWKVVNADAGAPISILAMRDWATIEKCHAAGLSREKVMPFLKGGE